MLFTSKLKSCNEQVQQLLSDWSKLKTLTADVEIEMIDLYITLLKKPRAFHLKSVKLTVHLKQKSDLHNVKENYKKIKVHSISLSLFLCHWCPLPLPTFPALSPVSSHHHSPFTLPLLSLLLLLPHLPSTLSHHH